jgi:hypothetical protein
MQRVLGVLLSVSWGGPGMTSEEHKYRFDLLVYYESDSLAKKRPALFVAPILVAKAKTL